MKKLIYLLLLLTMPLLRAQTTVNYTTSTADITNSERGFYSHTETHSNSYSNLNQTSLNTLRTQGISLILRVFYLEDFKTSNISAAYLTSIQNDLTKVRNSGLKCIIRFAYSDDDSDAVTTASKAQILSHLTQLTTVLQANEDVIFCLQFGNLGTWGENWRIEGTPAQTEFGTEGNLTNAQYNNRKDVLEAFMNILPNKKYQVRTPTFKQKFYGLTPLTGLENTNKGRVGNFNDCFLADYGSEGYENQALEFIYLAQDTKYTLMGGETCGTNSPRSLYPNASSIISFSSI